MDADSTVLERAVHGELALAVPYPPLHHLPIARHVPHLRNKKRRNEKREKEGGGEGRSGEEEEGRGRGRV